MHIVIIGNGISGTAAARHIRKQSEHKITMISSESSHFFSRTALMYIYMGHMRYEDTKPYEDWFWDKNRIELLQDHVTAIDFENKQLSFKSSKEMKYDALILALGSKSNKFGWPGQDLPGVGGLYHLQDLEMMEAYSKNLKRAVIVGGGLIGLEMAEMFHSRDIPVTMLVREESYWDAVMPAEESKMITQHIRDNNIDLRLEVNLGEIHADENGNACAVTVKETGERIDCGYVGLTAGVSPNIGFLKGGDLELGRGIKVNSNLQTNMKNVYAIGDCAELSNPQEGRRPIEAVWYTGRLMGETVAKTICGDVTSYDPPIWYNSAKFLDIEYQVYGTVLSKAPEYHVSLIWVHPNENKSVRIVYDANDKHVIGFNLMGIRYRHEVCEKWLEEKTHVEEVLKDLSLADFDPEFFRSYHQEIIDLYNRKNGTSLKPQKKASLNKVLRFLQVKS